MHFECARTSNSGVQPPHRSLAACLQLRRPPGSSRETPHEVSAPLLSQRRLVLAATSEPRAAARAATGGSGATATSSSPPGSRLEAAVEALQTRLRKAVLAEQAEQQKQQQAAYSRSSAQRLARDGLALLNLAAAPQGRQALPAPHIRDEFHYLVHPLHETGIVARTIVARTINNGARPPLPSPRRMFADFVWSFSLPTKGPLPYHRFKRGDTVLLAPALGPGQLRRSSRSGGASAPGEGEGLEGTVLEVGRQELLVAVGKAVSEALGAAPPGAKGPGRGGG